MFVRPTSYLTPQSCEYHSGHSYYPYHDAPRFTAPSYPSQAYFFQQPSAEEFEEHEYRRALEVIANHHRRQAAKETAIRRQQLVEATRQQYFTALAAEVEQQRQEQLLAARHSEFIRSRQDRARLAAAERQHGPGAFLRELRRGRPVCLVCGMVIVRIILIGSSDRSSAARRGAQAFRRYSEAAPCHRV